MDELRLHLVGGFLGSGKTTAIIQAAKRLVRNGKRVGIITNDQGKYLVDTAFFRLEDLPTVEVTGGCFCCSYPDLEQQLDTLVESVHPDVIFAESVGSCADLVATVIKPLARLRDTAALPVSFSVFVDARLLRLYLQDEDLPFSEEVVYIFAQQIEEAGLLVINKVDLLTDGQREKVLERTQEAYPHMPVLAQSSLSARDGDGWVDWIESGRGSGSERGSGRGALPEASLSIDYDRYGTGEARLAWIDEELEIVLAEDGEARACVIRLIESVLGVFQSQKATIGHLKFLVTGSPGIGAGGGAGRAAKVSFTSLPEPGWEAQVPEGLGSKVTLLLNGRAEADAEDLEAQIEEGVKAATGSLGCQVRVLHKDVFYPKPPKPTHRMA